MEFLLQTVPSSCVMDQLVVTTEKGLRMGFAAVLGLEQLPDHIWNLATVPLWLGGLGLRAPSRVQYASRLASLVSVADFAKRLGASEAVITMQLSRALVLYERQLGASLNAPLKPEKFLQAQLTEPLHRRVLDAVIQASGATQTERLNALSTPHSTSWTTDSALHSPLSAGEFRCALRWILGIPFRETSYRCPDCGRPADKFGVPSSSIRGHRQGPHLVAGHFGSAPHPSGRARYLGGTAA